MNAPTSTDAPVVERLDVSTYRVPLPEAHSDGTLSWDSVTAVVVHAHGGGRCGLGLTYGPAACATLIEELLVPVVERRRVDAVAGSWAAMVRAIRNAGRPGVSSMAIAAVDIALWDLLARNLDVPLDAVLGRVRDRVAVYGGGGFTSLDDAALAEQLGGWVHHDGMARVKMKIAAGWGADERRDLERVALARSTIGDAGLFVDANGGYGTKQALRVGGALEQLGVTWFEEPVSSDDLDGLRRLRNALALDVTAGEYGYDLAYFERMAAAGAVDVLQVDVTRCAGITELRRVAAVAAAHGLDVSTHCAPALHLHLGCSVPNLRHLEYFADHIVVERALLDGLVAVHDGALVPEEDRPGHGLQLRHAEAERYRIA